MNTSNDGFRTYFIYMLNENLYKQNKFLSCFFFNHFLTHHSVLIHCSLISGSLLPVPHHPYMTCFLNMPLWVTLCACSFSLASSLNEICSSSHNVWALFTQCLSIVNFRLHTYCESDYFLSNRTGFLLPSNSSSLLCHSLYCRQFHIPSFKFSWVTHTFGKFL